MTALTSTLAINDDVRSTFHNMFRTNKKWPTPYLFTERSPYLSSTYELKIIINRPLFNYLYESVINFTTKFMGKR